jgi:titin
LNVISDNLSSGVEFSGFATFSNVLEGNRIGTDASGLVALGNSTGVFVNGSPGNQVGGSAPFSGNLISGNFGPGVHIFGTVAIDNALQGNKIGTNAAGNAPLSNGSGVFIDGAPANLLGGNILSGNTSAGVMIQGTAASGNVLEGNVVGTDATGDLPVSNEAGVFIDGAPRNLLLGNILSGNTTAGVIIQGTSASGNVLEENLVGLNATGSRVVGSSGSQQSGVLILDASQNIVGGTSPAARNVLSGNIVGVNISNFDASGNVVEGNFIGTNANGVAAVPNQTGVYINSSPSNIIGGSTPGAGNLISGNTVSGVNIYGTLTSGNLVQGNLIGTDVTGTAAIPNSSGVFIELAPSNTIGGPTSAAGNLISGNLVAGVYIFDQASGNLVQFNRIGITSGGKALGNLQYGVLLFNAANNIIDMSKATGNIIANSGIGNFREFTGPVSSG